MIRTHRWLFIALVVLAGAAHAGAIDALPQRS